MNKRMRQDMDRTVDHAVTDTRAIKKSRIEEYQAQRREQAKKRLPIIEDLLRESSPGERRKCLISVRADYRKALGMTADRRLMDMGARP